MVENAKRKIIIFTWHDDENKAHAKFILPPEVVERFIRGETIEFTFQPSHGRVDVRQRRKPVNKSDIIIPCL